MIPLSGQCSQCWTVELPNKKMCVDQVPNFYWMVAASSCEANASPTLHIIQNIMDQFNEYMDITNIIILKKYKSADNVALFLPYFLMHLYAT